MGLLQGIPLNAKSIGKVLFQSTFVSIDKIIKSTSLRVGFFSAIFFFAKIIVGKIPGNDPNF